MKELSLRPYPGKIYIAKTKPEYHKAHEDLFNEPDERHLTMDVEGRCTFGCGPDGKTAYLVFARKPHILAHELSHVILLLFEHIGVDPREAGGEPFCYLLSQLIFDAGEK